MANRKPTQWHLWTFCFKMLNQGIFKLYWSFVYMSQFLVLGFYGSCVYVNMCICISWVFLSFLVCFATLQFGWVLFILIYYSSLDVCLFYKERQNDMAPGERRNGNELGGMGAGRKLWQGYILWKTSIFNWKQLYEITLSNFRHLWILQRKPRILFF